MWFVVVSVLLALALVTVVVVTRLRDPGRDVSLGEA